MNTFRAVSLMFDSICLVVSSITFDLEVLITSLTHVRLSRIMTGDSRFFRRIGRNVNRPGRKTVASDA